MGAKLGPRIVADNLVLALDCADAKSYPGEPTVNILTDPNDFGGSDWNLKSGTFTNNSTTGPRGTLTACKVVATSTDPYCYSNAVHTIAAGSITLSFWVKGEGNTIGKTGDCRFNFSGTATGSDVTTSWGVNLTNEWQKVSVTATATGAGTIKFGIECPNSAVSGDVMYLADPQLEQKSYFTPFTEQNRAAITSFLIHGNVGAGTSFEDSSPNKITVSNQNSVSHGGTSNFGGSAIQFSSSSSQQLTSASTDVINFGTEDWTIEFWFNMTSGSTARMHALSCGPGSTNNIDFNFNDSYAFWLYWNSGGSPYIRFGNDGDYGDGNWHHLMATRASGMVRVWVDGVHKGSNNYSSSTSMGQTASIYVGGKSGVYWDGFLDEIRIIKGTALWSGSGNFAVPTERFKNGAWLDTSGNENNGNFINGVNTGTSHYRVGDVIYPAGTNSARYLDFDGTDQYVDCGSIGSMTAFTVELWINPDAVQDYQNPIDCNYSYNGTTGNIGPRLELRTGASPNWIISGDTGNNNAYYYIVARSGAPSTGTWYHAVLTYDGSGNASGLKSYWDGSLVTSGATNVNTPSAVWVNTMNNVELGHGFHLGSSRHFNGKIGSAKIYTQELTAAEVLENYNSTKSRFS